MDVRERSICCALGAVTLAEMIETEYVRWGKVIKAAGLEPE